MFDLEVFKLRRRAISATEAHEWSGEGIQRSGSEAVMCSCSGELTLTRHCVLQAVSEMLTWEGKAWSCVGTCEIQGTVSSFLICVRLSEA
jgi:hypothetical protein